MGLPDAFFWSLTLPLFIRLWERHRAREKQHDRRAGEIAVAIYNVNRNTEQYPDPWDWTDVFVEHKDAPEEQTEEQLLHAMDAWVVATKGKA